MDISMVESIVNEKYNSIKKNGYINVNRILHLTIQGYQESMGNKNLCIHEEEELKKISINYLAKIVITKYKEGLLSVFKRKFDKEQEDDVYYMVQMECPPWFKEKYSRKLKLNARYSLINKLISKTSKLYFLRGTSMLHDIEEKKITDLTDQETKDLNKKIDYTIFLKSKIKNLFELNDKYEEMLIDDVIEIHIENKSNYLKEKYEYYDAYNQYAFERLKRPYYELNFEDFTLIFISILRFYSRIKPKLELGIDNSIIIKITASKKVYNKLAESFQYELQLKPYAMKYDQYIKKFYSDKLETDNLINNDNFDKTLQFHELNEDEASHYPPYMDYQEEKELKFRRYFNNDEFHDCPGDPEFNDSQYQNYKENLNKKDLDHSFIFCKDNCSKFRNIDKFRILNRSLEKLIKFSVFTDYYQIIVFKRNYKAYQNDLTFKNLFLNSANIFDASQQNKFIQIVRNYFGERIAYYFLFLRSMNMWLLFPVILGIITFISSVLATKALKRGDIQTFSNLKLNYSDVILFIFSFLITIWASLFLKVWNQTEKLYTYFWGMENFQLNEPNHESFQKESNMQFIFDEQIPFYPSWKRKIKQTISYTIVLFMICVTAVLSYLLFRLKAIKTNNGKDESLEWPIIVALLNGLQIRTMSIIYDYVARKLCQWENYEKKSQRDDSLAIKLVFFEFINHYIALYYIAFLKPYLNEPCIENNCLKEIEIQLYIILVLHFMFNLMGLLIPFVKIKWRIRKMKENIKNYNETIKKKENNKDIELNYDSFIINESEEFNENKEINTHSLEHQIICEPCDSLMEEYDELVKLFGYVCFFSVSAPLTPAIIFILTYLEKFCDSYKLFYLSRISIIDGCNGIEIYNNIFKVFYFIGMLTNIGLVLFTNPHLINTEEYKSLDFRNNYDFIVKFIIFAILENFILIIMGFMDYNILPKWFDHLFLMKALYVRKYYNRDTETLPHKNYVKVELDESNNFLSARFDENEMFKKEETVYE